MYEIHRQCLLAVLNNAIDNSEPITYLPAPLVAVGPSLSLYLSLSLSLEHYCALAMPLLQRVQVNGPGI